MLMNKQMPFLQTPLVFFSTVYNLRLLKNETNNDYYYLLQKCFEWLSIQDRHITYSIFYHGESNVYWILIKLKTLTNHCIKTPENLA